jgi:hypothetical protein
MNNSRIWVGIAFHRGKEKTPIPIGPNAAQSLDRHGVSRGYIEHMKEPHFLERVTLRGTDSFHQDAQPQPGPVPMLCRNTGIRFQTIPLQIGHIGDP